MKNDKKWLLDEIRKLPCEVQRGHGKIKVVDILPLIDQLDEPVVVPKFVDDFIKSKEKDNLDKWKMASSFISYIKYKKGSAYEWSQQKGNMDKFLSALVNGYEVEKEKLYVVELSNSNEKFGSYENVFLNKRNGIVFIDSCRLFINDIKKYIQFGLTEKEIKDYDERFWPFAVEVEE